MPSNHSIIDDPFITAQWQLPSPPTTPRTKKIQLHTASIKQTQEILPLSPSESPFLGFSSSSGPSVCIGSRDKDSRPELSQDSDHQSPRNREEICQDQDDQRPLFRERHSFGPDSPTPRVSTVKRRCLSVDAIARSKKHFSFPDRFVAPRSSPLSDDNTFRSSRHPQALTSRERHSRQRDHSQDPFRPHSTSRSREVIRHNSNSRRSYAPHFIPHFVQDNEHTPVVWDSTGNIDIQRQVSAGGVWNVGGASALYNGPLPAVDNGRGALVGSGTTAPFHIAHFLDVGTPGQDVERHRDRLALALDIDEANRVLQTTSPVPLKPQSPNLQQPSQQSPLVWKDGSWTREGSISVPSQSAPLTNRAVPSTPFRVLDAPRLRDDFYCSTLAYSDTSRTLAVGLSSRVYLWSEEVGVQFPPLTAGSPSHYVTSLSFSSTEGAKSILAVGRQNGQVSLWSTLESDIRFEAQQPNPVSCLSFSPYPATRPSEFLHEQQALCEDLLVGDDMGNVFYYSIEWPDQTKQRLYPDWTGTMTLLAKINAHSQQICGISWSPDRRHFATGGNDNVALLFEISTVLNEHNMPEGTSLQQVSEFESFFPIIRMPPSSPDRRLHLIRLFSRRHSHLSPRNPFATTSRQSRSFSASDTDPGRRPPQDNSRTIHHLRDRRYPSLPVSMHSSYIPTHPYNSVQRHAFPHAAAVKALAFPVWQPTLLATGGGSNDRAIHFFHTGSGATLATISVHAQVTALIWSRTKREICATFGYAQPEHGVRIAVFSWPSCDCVVSIPWGNNTDGGSGGGRALWAIPYPGGPNDGSSASGAMARRNRGRRLLSEQDGQDEIGMEERQDNVAVSHDGRRTESRNRHGTSATGDGEGGTWWSRTEQEGCIIVASSDESVKFHEVWAGGCGGTTRQTGERGGRSIKDDLGLALGSMGGVLGGSNILEGLCEGIEVEASREVIR